MTSQPDDIAEGNFKPIAIYIIYLAALFSVVPFFIGVIFAYIFRGSASAWARTHYDHAISMFWRLVFGSIALGILVGISIPLMAVVIGFPLLAIALVGMFYLWLWMLFRCLKGIADANALVPYRGPIASWKI